MYRISSTPVRQFPFPHLYVEDVFPAEFYAEIRRHMVGDQGYVPLVDTGRVTQRYSGARSVLFPKDLEACDADDGYKRFWKAVFDAFSDPEFGRLWLTVFGSTIREKLAGLPPERGGGRPAAEIGLYNEAFLVRDRTSYSLGPHCDSASKVVSVLFYLPPDASRPELGTSIYVPKDRSFSCAGGPHYPFDDFERVATLPYKPNSMVAFPQSPKSFHGVEPLDAEDVERDTLFFDLKIRVPR